MALTQLTGENLYTHVKALANTIGPRPPGHPEEALARRYICRQLQQMDVTELPFLTIDTWGYGLIAPLLLTLFGGGLAANRRIRKLGGLAALLGAYNLWQMLNSRPRHQILYPLYPKHPGGSLLACIPPVGEVKQQVVLIGHTDTNKARLSFSPLLRGLLLSSTTSLQIASLLHGLTSLIGWRGLRHWTRRYLLFGLASLIADEMGPFVDGANDNASAVACVLGVGQQTLATPLQHTELWLAFTGSEEVGHDGLNVILDQYGQILRDAYFIDFELVGKGNIYYVTRHSGLSYFTPYYPHPALLVLAEQTTHTHPELQVHGRDVTIMEEVATLNRRGFKGICLVGLDETGWPPNWHRKSDTAAHIEPQALETAAHFAWGMIQQLEQQL